jgi:hypothetical protein
MKYGLIALGVIVAVVGLVNHYAVHANPIAHTSIILIGVGGVIAVIGVAMAMLGGSAAS